MPDGRGGPRQPTNPAAVSGPGALSARTDGGPGSKSQPLRVPTGGAYGETQAATEQQQAAPLAAGGPVTSSAPGGAPGGVTGAAPGGFGPTQRPNEPITAGLPQQKPEMDSTAVLRAIYERYPSPYIAALLANG